MSFLLWDSLLPGLQMFFIFCGSLCIQSCLSLPSETPGFHFSLKYKFVCLTTDAHLCIRLPPMSNLCFLLLRLMRGLLQAWIRTCLSPRGLINVFFLFMMERIPWSLTKLVQVQVQQCILLPPSLLCQHANVPASSLVDIDLHWELL